MRYQIQFERQVVAFNANINSVNVQLAHAQLRSLLGCQMLQFLCAALAYLPVCICCCLPQYASVFAVCFSRFKKCREQNRRKKIPSDSNTTSAKKKKRFLLLHQMKVKIQLSCIVLKLPLRLPVQMRKQHKKKNKKEKILRR